MRRGRRAHNMFPVFPGLSLAEQMFEAQCSL